MQTQTTTPKKRGRPKKNSLPQSQSLPRISPTLKPVLPKPLRQLKRPSESLGANLSGAVNTSELFLNEALKSPLSEKTSTTVTTSQTADSPVQEPIDSGPSFPEPALKIALSIPFSLVAEKTHYDGFNLKEDEQSLLAPILDTVLKRYMPNIAESPHAALATLAVSIGGLALSKFLAYRVWKTEQVKVAHETAVKEVDQPIDPQNPFPTFQPKTQ